jgi:hypothetical protein
MAKREVRRPADRSVVGQERDAAVREGPLRDSHRLAFVMRPPDVDVTQRGPPYDECVDPPAPDC